MGAGRAYRSSGECVARLSREVWRARGIYRWIASFFHRWDHKSDVDVAIGGAPDRVLDVMKVVEDAVDRDVDVIDLDLHMSADRFRQKGMKIYG